MVDDGAQQAHHGVCLRQVDAGGALAFPQECHRIEADDARALLEVVKQDADELEQHIGIGEVQVDLVIREGCPKMAQATTGMHRREQGRWTRAHDLGDIGVGVHLDEVVAAGLHAGQIIGEPQ